MKILGLVAENFKKIRVIEINPQGNLVQITGKNGQGKTSVLDSLWFALLGPKANLEKIVRKGAEKCTVKLDLGELIVTRNESAELQEAQRTNRAIDTRIKWDELKQKQAAKAKAAQALTRQIEAREEKKRTVLTDAKLPVEGLIFNETQVLYNGLPLENLGEGEQIRISTQLAMAANPKLRVIFIRHGEALDEDRIAAMAKLAEEHDFQIWMSKVDSTGNIGIVMEDGMVKETHEA